MNTVLIVFTVLLLAKLCAELILSSLNTRHVKSMASEVPEAFKGFVDEETYKKSTEYTLAKARFGFIETIFDAVIVALVILTGFLPWLWETVEGFLGTNADKIWGQALVLVVVTLVLSIPSIPFNWWDQFRLEEQFGFNKSTVKLWIVDKIKMLCIGLVIGVPLICALLWVVNLNNWWIWAFVMIFGFQLLMMVIAPMFILPLFNKFEPLEEGSLRDRLMELADRTGFAAKTILVVDGSKRSGHSNAYFTGFGKFRRIVLYDTLIDQLSEEELAAVLAHEIGHYKLGHIPKMMAVSAISMLAGFWVLSVLLESSWFLEGFYFDPSGGLAPTLLLFSMLSDLVFFWLTPLMSLFSRKHEYEADHFAREAMSSPEPLIRSLRILNEKNLSNLTPHPSYSGFYYSHPTLLEREASLNAVPA